MFIKNGIYRNVDISKLTAPIAEGTVLTASGLVANVDGSDAYGIVPEKISAIPPTKMARVVIGGTIDLQDPANANVTISDAVIKALGDDINFVPAVEENEVPKPAGAADAGKEVRVNSDGDGYALYEPIFIRGSGDHSITVPVPEGQHTPCTATNNASFAGGDGAVSSGVCSFAYGGMTSGTGTTASSSSAIALGYGVTASGGAAFASGQLTEAVASMSSTFGSRTKANGRACMVIGQSNIVDENEVDTSHGAGARKYLFIIGNGSSNGNTKSNALTVDWDGNIVCNNIPAPPSTAGTYSLKCTVDASGNATYSWA